MSFGSPWVWLGPSQATLEQTKDWAKLPRLKRAHVKEVAAVSEKVLPAMLDWEAAALAEPYRETAHEAEVLAAGQVLADWRLPLDS